MLGIFGTLVGAGWLDPLAAVAVGLMVSRMGFEVARDAILTLADASSASEDFMPRVQEVLGAMPSMLACSDVRIRLVGRSAFVEARVSSAAGATGEAVLSSAVSDLEKRLLALPEVSDVRLSFQSSVHADATLPGWWELPAEPEHDAVSREGPALHAELKEGRRRVVAQFPELGMPRSLIFESESTREKHHIDRHIDRLVERRMEHAEWAQSGAELATGAKKSN